MNNINITQKGYVYIWVSNESNQNHNTYFDDLKVTHTKGPVLQEDHYYPFGMNIQALSSNAPLSKPNQFKYNGKELNEEFDLGLYDYGWRMYDPVLGRWNGIDRKAEDYYSLSPYNYVSNNPVIFIDPNGEFIGTLIGGVVGGIVGGVKAAIKGESIARGAVEGAITGAITGAAIDLTVATGGTAGAVILAGAAGGGLGGALGDLAGQVTENLMAGQGLEKAVTNVNFDNTLDKAADGAMAGAIGGAAGVVVAKVGQAAVQSTSATQKIMSANITETAETLSKMGANTSTIQTATSKITGGMGAAGRSTSNAVAGFEAATGAVTSVATYNISAPVQIKKEERSGGYQIEHKIKAPSGILK
ncbi:RHS repeat-associated core domain-containing protein [Roseivirga sp. UBA838]|uniref:RHS repeat-associated core domain-containing protein n=2 Tax=Roseivirga TaxID=290180 RepID=UPI00257DDE47|nr:RHS repeat-associated core domain-containing protein [Roseivirga sp. UBA838]